MMKAINLSATQVAALQVLRETFSQIDTDQGLPMNDCTFLHYLKARNFQADKASDMLRNTIEWRKINDLMNIDTWKPVMAVENRTGKIYTRGYDKDGHVIMYMKPSKENSTNYEGNIKHLIYNMEKAVQCMQQHRDSSSSSSSSSSLVTSANTSTHSFITPSSSTNSIDNTTTTTPTNTTSVQCKDDKLVLIIDFEDYNLMNAPPLTTSIATLDILQNHYPERLHCAYLVKPPWIFNFLFNAVSPFIDPVTSSKIKFLNDDISMKRELLAVIDSNVLERQYGGTDDREFISEYYISTPLYIDYYTALQLYYQK